MLCELFDTVVFVSQVMWFSIFCEPFGSAVVFVSLVICAFVYCVSRLIQLFLYHMYRCLKLHGNIMYLECLSDVSLVVAM